MRLTPTTLEITDVEAVYSMLVKHGIGFVNGGYLSEVQQKIHSLSTPQKKDPKIRLLQAYAEFIQARYRTVLEMLDVIELEKEELPEHETKVMTWVRTSADYQLGRIDSDQYMLRLADLAATEPTDDFSNFRFDYLRRSVLEEYDLSLRMEAENLLRAELSKLTEKELKTASGLRLRFIVLEAEMASLGLAFSNDVHELTLQRRFFGATPGISESFQSALVENDRRQSAWTKQLDIIFAETDDLSLKADIAVQKALFAIQQFSLVSFHFMVEGVAPSTTPDEIFLQYKESLSAAIQIYDSLGLYERRLRAQNCLAEMLAFHGDVDEAQEAFSIVRRDSEKMGFVHVTGTAEQPMSSLIDRLEANSSNRDVDEVWANHTDEELEAFSRDMMAKLRVPDSRLSNFMNDLIACRVGAVERLTWCKHIELVQDLAHTQSPETLLATTPQYFARCQLHGISSGVGKQDHRQVINAFKRGCCISCPDRDPKRPDKCGADDRTDD